MLQGGGGAGGGNVQNDGLDDEFMQLCDGSCNLCLQNFVGGDHMRVLLREILVSRVIGLSISKKKERKKLYEIESLFFKPRQFFVFVVPAS